MANELKEKKITYLGNSLIKKDGVTHEWTQHEIDEYVKCMKSPAYFAKNYIKIINLDRGLINFDLYPYQEKMFEHFTNNRFNIVLASRQSGKCSDYDTKIKIKNKHTGEIKEISIGKFHELLNK